jgi:hypothetical protein
VTVIAEVAVKIASAHGAAFPVAVATGRRRSSENIAAAVKNTRTEGMRAASVAAPRRTG